MHDSAVTSGYAPLVEGTRVLSGHAAHTETLHQGVICVRAGDGTPIANVGDPGVSTPLRSTAKAFQLLPFVLDGPHHRLPQGRIARTDGTRDNAPGLADLAVMMSSHNGQAMHTERIGELLGHVGLTPVSLRCGIHPPLHQETYEKLIREELEPEALHCNCSGKHTNMLWVCQARGWSQHDYLDIDHPLQQRIQNIISALGDDQAPLSHVIDGCSLPTFVVSMSGLTRLYGHLAWPRSAPCIESGNIADALRLLFRAGVTYPEMIAGTGRLDTELMQAFGGLVFAKTGAAGVYAMAVQPTERYKTGLAIAIKVADGDATSSIRRVIALEMLKQLGVAPPEERQRLETMNASRVTNFRGIAVGELRAIFELTR